MNATPEQSRPSTMLHRAALVLAVVLVFARATMTQGLRDPDLAAPGSPAAPGSAGPTAGLILDLLLCVPALLVLLRRIIDPRFRLRFSLAHGLFLGLATLAAASSFWAADPFAAAVTGTHFVAAAVLFWSMSQLVRSWNHVRLIAAVSFAILLVSIAQGVIYRTVELPDLIDQWNRTRLDEFARRGWPPESFQARLFEVRVLAGELMGFNTSPNTFAALIVMLATVAAGAAIQRIVDRDESGWPMAIIALAAPSIWVLYHTGSRTAAAAGMLGAVALAVSPWLTRRGLIYLIAAATLIAGTGGLIAWGLTHDSLVHPSLTFRWRYWVGSMRIFMEHPLAGIGWGSFGDYYLGARLPVASEEVKDPHNLIVRPLVELGAIGGMLMIAWVARLGWEITAPVRLSGDEDDRPRATRPIVWVCLGTLLVTVLASIDFTTDTGYVLLELIKRLLFLVLAALGMVVVVLRSSKEPWLDGRPAPWMACAMGLGIGLFLVCNVVDFSIFEPGPMGVMAMLAGTALGARGNNAPQPGAVRIGPIFGLTIAALLWIAAGIGLVAPIAVAERAARQADALLRQNRPAAAAALLGGAFQSLWIPNPDYAHRAAIALMYAQAPPERVRAMLDAAQQANPLSATVVRLRARFEMQQPEPDAWRALPVYERLLQIDPYNVPARLEFAAALARFSDRARAIEQYREALRIDNLLDPEEQKRLTQEQIEQIQRLIEAI